TAGTGFIQVNNNGTITGRVDFSGATGVQFNNYSNTSWHTSGVSTFSDVNDELNNGNVAGSVTRLTATTGATTCNFLTGADQITNYDRSILVAGGAGVSQLSIVSAGTMIIHNSGTIVLGSTNGGLTTDNEANDSFNAPTAAFVSSG